MGSLGQGLGDKFASGKVLITPEGGIAVKMTAGATMTKGTVVDITSTGKVIPIVVNVPDPIGVVYDASITADTEGYIVISGIADVYFIGNSTAGHLARGFVTGDAGYVTGQALSEAVPSAPFSSDKHFYEIGHVMVSRTGAGLAKVCVHFN